MGDRSPLSPLEEVCSWSRLFMNEGGEVSWEQQIGRFFWPHSSLSTGGAKGLQDPRKMKFRLWRSGVPIPRPDSAHCCKIAANVLWNGLQGFAITRDTHRCEFVANLLYSIANLLRKCCTRLQACCERAANGGKVVAKLLRTCCTLVTN